MYVLMPIFTLIYNIHVYLCQISHLNTLTEKKTARDATVTDEVLVNSYLFIPESRVYNRRERESILLCILLCKRIADN